LEYSILKDIKSPTDIKKLNKNELSVLCDEIRNCIIETVSKNGGHLASNLGSVELTVALHRVFNSPEDAIIFDVGHQCYTHKLLTGRFDKFASLRTEGGISGFMRPSESEHDPFITGHSSNSISAAFGIFKAKKLLGQKGTAVAVIGDGAMTGGMAYEALNNAGSSKGNFIVILNDNEMSISENVGSLARSLTKMRNKPRYHKFKNAIAKILMGIPFIGKYLKHVISVLKDAFKTVIYKKNIFTSLGFDYLGPVDGHNISQMEDLFKIAYESNEPSLIHVVTTKGKGYSLAEEFPKNYHGVSPFDICEGCAVNKADTFSSIAGKTLCKLAETDSKICAITAAMTEGTGLSEFQEKFPERFFDVGIAEQHAVTFSAGLSKQGAKAIFVVYSSFLQRAYDQLVHDVATEGLPLRLLIDRAGIVGEDGETHQGVFDISFLTSVPKIQIYSPATHKELEYRIEFAAQNDNNVAIRYPRGAECENINFDFKSDYNFFKSRNDTLVISYGRLFFEACKAYEKQKNFDVLKLNKIFPLEDKLITEILNYKRIFIFEETEKSGGVGEHLSALLHENGFKGEFKIRAINNKFVPSMTVGRALALNGLDSASMIKFINGVDNGR